MLIVRQASKRLPSMRDTGWLCKSAVTTQRIVPEKSLRYADGFAMIA
jgi:hypothetical protein